MREVLIKTEDLCKSFIIGKTGTHVLKNINIEIYKEDFTVIMGSSGSGKSTLLYSLSTMDNPTSGKVTLLGEDISKINEEEAGKIRNKKIGFIFQGINLLPDLTVYENVTYAAFSNKKNKSEVQSRADEILKDLELYEERNKYPAEISGGMQQRVAIARVKAHLRRQNFVPKQIVKEDVINYGALKIYSKSYKVLIDEKEIMLTTREFQILDFFAKNSGQVFSKEQLYEGVWGYTEFMDENTIAVYVKRLRGKLGNIGQKSIKTVWGIGYKWEYSNE